MLKNQLVNTSTGSHTFGISPDGKYFLYWKDNKYQAYDLDAGTTRTLGGEQRRQLRGRASSIIPVPKPAYGIAGYTSDGKGVIVEQRYDLWLLPLDGSRAAQPDERRSARRTRSASATCAWSRSTSRAAADRAAAAAAGGAAPRARRSICRSRSRCRPTASTRRRPASTNSPDGQLKELVYEDASFSTPVKAAKADKYLFTRQTFVEFPDLRVSGPDFKDSRKITDANPQQAEYHLGPSHPVRLQEQGRPAPAGHPRAARRLQARREAADARELLRGELAEPPPLCCAVVPHGDGHRRRSRR